MPARAQKQVKQFRGVLRARMKRGLSAVTSILRANTKATVPFLTNDQQVHLLAAETDLTALLAQKVFV